MSDSLLLIELNMILILIEDFEYYAVSCVFVAFSPCLSRETLLKSTIAIPSDLVAM